MSCKVRNRNSVLQGCFHHISSSEETIQILDPWDMGQGRQLSLAILYLFFLQGLRNNTDRVLFFLNLIESVKPAGFEKFCFFLENHGNTSLCDDLWLELISVKGHFEVEPGVIEGVRQYIRAKIAQGQMSTDDLEELIMIAATRCQVKKVVKARQDKSICGLAESEVREVTGDRNAPHNAIDTVSIYEEVEKLCAEIEKCMPGFLDNSVIYEQSEALAREKHHLEGQEMTSLVTGGLKRISDYKRTTALSQWMNSLKRKLNIPLSPLQEVGPLASPTGQRDLKLNQATPKMLNDLLGSQQVKSAKKSREMTLSGTSSSGVSRLGPHGKRSKSVPAKTAGKVRAPTRSAKTSSDESKSRMEICRRDPTSQAERSNRLRSGKVKGKVKPQPRGNPNNDKMSDAVNVMNGNKPRRKGRKKKEDSDEELPFELPDYRPLTLDEEDNIHKEVLNLHRQKAQVDNVRRAINGKVNPRMANRMKVLEQSYWSKRCDVMKHCQSTGYYYFLSAHRRHRCHACMAGSPAESCECHNQSPIESSKQNVNLYRQSSFISLSGQSGESSSDLYHRLRAMKFDDCDCPGAIEIPGQEYRRCIACAYANEQEAMIYDAAVTSDGAYHLTFPVLDEYAPKPFRSTASSATKILVKS